MKILVHPEGQRFRLMCADNRMSVMPAGGRLFRAPPIPDIQFTHDLAANAAKDALTLQRYVDQTHGKQQTKKELREAAQ